MSKSDKRPSAATADQARLEAEARRKAQSDVQQPKELHGREGPDPARFGDWENKGIASDF